MARGKKSGPSRMDLRRQAEAAEARDKDVEEVEDEEVEESEEGSDEDSSDEDGEAAPKSKAKKKAPTKAKAPAKRTRTPKEVRMKAMWVVFDNGSKRLETFPFPQKAEAEEYLAKKIEEKKGTFYIQLVKEPLES